ncbi:MAG TPA: DUF1501 domain-containing protein [Acidimicrobiia bacterium]|nr:DUF1501 domain-containing protein [Acidimicrobiia bacterium]
MSPSAQGQGGYSRREFLRHLGLGGAAAVVGGYALDVWDWSNGPSAHAATFAAGDLGAGAPGRTLVVVEMAGGNDGLNTVVPLDDGVYHDLRPTLGVTDPIDLGDGVGFHPNLARLAQRYEQGDVALVEGLGYPDPDLSHFGSIAIWWSARGGAGQSGWLGAYLDGTVGFDDPLAAIGIGPGPSPALRGASSFATTIVDSSGLQPRLPAWLDDPEDLIAAWADAVPVRIDAAALVGQVGRAVGLTVEARTDLTDALEGTDASYDAGPNAARAYQDTTVVDSLALAAQLVLSPARPRVIYVSGIGDFDTHQGQAQRHPALMAELDEGIDAFFSTLEQAGPKIADSVVLTTVSEFGRRPSENGDGTDHGTAAVQLVVGPKVQGGRHGEAPSLTSLDRSGNLVHTADFRSLYATLLDGWLKVDAAAVLGETFERLPIF